ncbi:MAG: hypothetical protein M8350_08660 [Methanosarcinaceae archaeon]|nr:hypothetical protein [Methanosarcinaceae archaeon]
MKNNTKNKTTSDRKIVESDGGIAISSMGTEHSRNYMSGFDKIAVVVLLTVGLFYLISSIFQISYVFTDEFDSLIFIREVTQIFVGGMLILGAVRFIRKNTYLERIVDNMFEEIIYDRFEPVLRNIAEVQVGYDSVSSQIKSLNYSINDLKNSIEFAPSTGGYYQSHEVSTSASLRRVYNLFVYVVLLNVTLAVYMFMIYYPQWYIPYLSPLLFVMWWVTITYEFNQWDNSSAWMWVFAPILILPIYTMVFGLLTSTNQMFAIMYLVLGLYVVTYYTWSMYNSSGTLPFGLHKKLEDIANYEPAMDDRNNGEDGDMPRNGGLYRNSGEDGDMPRNGGLYRNSGEDGDMPRNGGLYRNSGEDGDMPRNGGLYRNSGDDSDMSRNGGLCRNIGATPFRHQNMDEISERLLLIHEEFNLLNEEISMYTGQRQSISSQNMVEQPVPVQQPIFTRKLAKGLYKKLKPQHPKSKK